MAKARKQTADKPESAPTRATKSSRVPQTDIPSVSLTEALRVPIALRDSYNLKASTPLDVGLAIGIAPTSGGFRSITGAAVAYGLTNGGYNAGEIGLTDLGRRVVMPTVEGDDLVAKLEAFERPRIIREFVEKYEGGRLPKPEIAKNVLHGMGVPLQSIDRAYELIVNGLQDLGYLRQVKDASFLQRPPAASVLTPEDEDIDDAEGYKDDEIPLDERLREQPPPPPPPRPNAIFLGHGKNKKPLDQLIKILDEYGIPHKEAIAEANAGRPIPVKVAETMRQCGAAILIFTADERFFDEAGNEVWRPSENVVHELGAASVLYENRIIIFKEDQVHLASNFSSIGYISFEKDKLGDKGIDLFRELVSFKIVSISVGGA